MNMQYKSDGDVSVIVYGLIDRFFKQKILFTFVIEWSLMILGEDQDMLYSLQTYDIAILKSVNFQCRYSGHWSVS